MKVFNWAVYLFVSLFVMFTACGGGGSDSKTSPSGLAGDVNGDGYVDLAIGAYSYGYVEGDPSPNNEGRVYVFFGSSSGPGSSPSQTIESPLPNDIQGFGKYTVLDDFNGDGYSDMAVGNNYFSGGYNGHVFIYYGSASGLASTPGTTIKGADDSNLGWSLCSGDFNGDGVNDLAIGAPYNAGAVHVFYGSSAHIADCDISTGGTADLSIPGPATFNYTLGSSVIAGDFNGDGYDDLAALAGDGGYMDIHNGSSTGLSATYSAKRSSLASNGSPGCLATGNVNGDAYDDLAVGAVSYVSSTGRVFVFHGSATGISATADQTLTGEYTLDHFGYSLSIADTDKDGYGDLAVGANTFRNNGINQYWGAIYIYNGSSSGIPATESSHLYGANQSDYLGTIVNFIDVNADGNVDLYALAEGYIYEGSDTGDFFGRGYLYSGTATGISFTSPWYYNAEISVP